MFSSVTPEFSQWAQDLWSFDEQADNKPWLCSALPTFDFGIPYDELKQVLDVINPLGNNISLCLINSLLASEQAEEFSEGVVDEESSASHGEAGEMEGEEADMSQGDHGDGVVAGAEAEDIDESVEKEAGEVEEEKEEEGDEEEDESEDAEKAEQAHEDEVCSTFSL